MTLFRPRLTLDGETNVSGVTVLSLKREPLDPAECALKDRVDGLVAEGQRLILIDLQGIPEMDSSDIGRLIRAHLSVRRIGGQVRLCNASPRVQTLLEVTRLHTVLEIYPDLDSALAAMLDSGAPAKGAPNETSC